MYECDDCVFEYKDQEEEPCKSCSNNYVNNWKSKTGAEANGEFIRKMRQIAQENKILRENKARDAAVLRAQMEEKAKAQAAESQEENMVNRKIPLPNVSPIFEHEASDYPDAVRVSFPNGRTIVYTRQVLQPEPMLVESIRIIRKWKTEGYQYTPPRRRRNQR